MFHMKPEIVIPGGVFDSRANHYYSQAIKVGETVYISGQVPWDQKGNTVGLGDLEAQTRCCLENMRLIMEAAGGKISDVVKLIFFLRDIRDFGTPEVNGVLRDYFGDLFPTSTAIQISNLWRPDFKLAIEGVAELGPKEVIVPPDVFDSRRRLYSQAIKAGNTIYVSGQGPGDEKGNIVGGGDFEAQSRMVYENMKRILKAAGLSMTEMIMMHMFFKDERYMHREAYSRVWWEYFDRRYPACTSIQFGNLSNRGYLMEVEGVAEMGDQEMIVPPDVADALDTHLFPQAIKVNNKLYVSGQISWDENLKSVGHGDFEAQTKMVYENMRRTLKAGGADMSDVVKLTAFTKDMRLVRRGDYGRIFKEFFGDHYPTLSIVQVDNFWRSDYMLEIEAIADV
jgi:reactive intermediate/imine deaminase